MLRFTKGFVGPQTEVHGIRIAIIPPSPDSGIAYYLVTANHLGLCPNKLLLFAQVGNRILTQIMSCIYQQRSCRRVMYPIVRASLCCGYLRTDAILECRSIIAEFYLLRRSFLRIVVALAC